MKKPRLRNNQKQVSEETRNLLDTAITNLVQALGSKASVLVFWDAYREAPSRYSTYGLSPTALKEIQPTLEDLTRRLAERSGSGTEELGALQAEINLQQLNTRIVALPIQSEGRFIAALCLLQPASVHLETTDLTDYPMASSTHQLVKPEEDFISPEIEPGFAVEPAELVTRNARLVKRLVEENQWLQTIFSYSPDGILIVNADCNIIGFNPAFSRLTGWSVDELRGHNCDEALRLSPKGFGEHCRVLCPLKMGLMTASGPAQRHAEVVLITKDAEERAVELSYSVILSPRGDVLGGVIGARDITARKEAEELQNTFLSVVSHELQTPIAIIKGYAGLYADETTEIKPAQVREKMKIIEEESERLSKLVDNLLYASRIQAGGIELERNPIDLERLIRRVAQKMKTVSNQHLIGTDLPEDLPAVLGDYDKIQEVLVNLVENAIKYSPHGGDIIISAEPTNTEVIIRVSDQGIGVPAADRERIFERFSRLDSRYVRERKGAGLGLYICKAIVEAHGGRIWVEAAESGNMGTLGSRFCFSLPREVPAQLPVLFGKI
ncbi:MAG: PAS domain S-box protein [Chloroflexi bacterium]|uniref:histidine kinase n=1 Tax=Candidatus Chlorohelix allophototropha TaxID=3003348 RepID=A0A8T7M708_9CHLR|nr:PAS domain S-box protein [Chloroflexota bacterium]WJW69768.1 ATP-binding protein [Chloroflexota bacterium L227-S17]